MPFQPLVKSSFQGDRGGAAEDAELLAELRAISSRSASAARFQSNDNDDDDDEIQAEVKPKGETKVPQQSPNKEQEGSKPAPAKQKSDSVRSKPVPPWKQKKQPNKANPIVEEDVVVLAEPPPAKSFQLLVKSTFQGDRGGAAEDAELLAELRAISSKSTSGSRFDTTGEEDEDNADSNGFVASSDLKDQVAPNRQASTTTVKQPKQSRQNNLPPWKKKPANKPTPQNTNDDLVVEVAGPPPPDRQKGLQPLTKSTFVGDRGGTAEDADLLAELRAISSKSSKGDRFASDPDDHHDQAIAAEKSSNQSEVEMTPSSDVPKKQQSSSSALPPWKRKNAKQQAKEKREENEDIHVQVVGPPPPDRDRGLKPLTKSTFVGERGGEAEDAELLAELRAISSKSASSDRFASNEEEETTNDEQEAPRPLDKSKAETAAVTKKQDVVPPWKRGGKRPLKKKEAASNDEITVEVAGPPPPDRTKGLQPLTKSTFVGERGGTAEDADLLAELRAISSKSSSSDRFAVDENDVTNDDKGAHEPMEKSKVQTVAVNKKQDVLPPWKRGGKRPPPKQTTSNDEIVVEVAGPPPPDRTKGLKPLSKSTFVGERGGDAEDAQLLAELRAISSKSSSSDRFAPDDDDENDKHEDELVKNTTISSGKLAVQGSSTDVTMQQNSLPPWKRGGKRPQRRKETASSDEFAEEVPGPPPPDRTKGLQPLTKSTFVGERGGSAEDADLLAELRAISSKSSSSDRFAENDNDDDKKGEKEEHPPLDNSKVETVAVDSLQSAVPPWKKTGKRPVREETQRNDEITVEVAGPPPPDRTKGLKPLSKSTFFGERGGNAEDADLLAELRAISAKSSSSDRFASLDDENHENVTADETKDSSDKPKGQASSKSQDVLPPWKRGGKRPLRKKEAQTNDEITVEVAGPPPPDRTRGLEPLTKSTFVGERGGTAEDADLLAELRAISTKSSSSDRFATNDNEENTNDLQNDCEANEPLDQSHVRKPNVPPWKRGGKRPARKKEVQTNDDTIVEVAGPPPLDRTKGLAPLTKSTFVGERGGTAEDAELLAELRAISSKSSKTDRFAPSDNEEKTNELQNELEESERLGQHSKPAFKQDDGPPWNIDGKRAARKKKGQTKDEITAEEAGPPPPDRTKGLETLTKSTFVGERGGTAEDADLLAELRAVSSKSTSDRFTTNETEEDTNHIQNEKDEFLDQPSVRNPSNKQRNIPPWKRGGKRFEKKKEGQINTEITVEVAGPPPPDRTKGLEPLAKSTFVGERGGTAEDADLLAELRAISTKSSSSDRFATNDNEEKTNILPNEQDAMSQDNVPHWKRGGKRVTGKKETQTGDEIVVEVAGPPPPDRTKGLEPLTKSSFVGERGGTAEDADLLAELRAISSKSSRSDRFATNENEEDANGFENEQEEKGHLYQSSDRKPDSQGSMPPWKKGGKRQARKKGATGNATSSTETKTALDVAPAHTERSKGLKTLVQSTFNGARGGAAEDAELLAELRAISTKSSGTGKFASDKNNEVDGSHDNVGNVATGTVGKIIEGSPVEPLTQEGDQMHAVQGVVPEDIPAKSLKPLVQSTFKGDRGGSAEDAALLAELRAISGKSANRFASGSNEKDEDDHVDITQKLHQEREPSTAAVASNALNEPVKQAGTFASSLTPFGGPAPSDSTSPPIVTREDLPAALSSKEWKKRKASYELLTALLGEITGEPSTQKHIVYVESNSIMEGLDEALPSMLKDSNAAALDAALEFANDYAEHCKGACGSGQASAIVQSLVKGSALASSRPSTLKRSKSLIMKLMEVGENGPSSIHAIVEVLLEEGLRARKPKVVLTSVSLVLESAQAFGAIFLPLASVSSTIPKILANSNAKVREGGMNIMAEICRSVGSKAPLQELIDSLKSSQVSQLDTLLEKQPEPSSTTRTLRHADSNDASAADAVAALEASAKEQEAKRFAARPAVDIMQAAAKTDYSAKVKLDKWSEKVGALDILLQCGGEKPYKLAPPSGTVKYGELVSDLKKFLGHTHFAVNSKAMAVLGMLAEGVGSKLYPLLRPLLPLLLDLSKDKKLTSATGKCLDTFFGNVLGFEHILDKDDALPTAVNEKKQKNALARTSAIAFLKRCVERRESAGPRAALSVTNAEDVAVLAVSKLKDLDPAPRKVSAEILSVISKIEDVSIQEACLPIFEDVKKNHPRVFKNIKSATVQTTQQDVVKPKKGPIKTAKPVSPAKRNGARDAPTKQSKPRVAAATSQRNTIDDRKTKPSPKNEDIDEGIIPSKEEAMALMESLCISNWGAPLDDGGISEGLKSTKWSKRKEAISQINEFLRSRPISELHNESTALIAATVVVVKEHTKEFKDSNVMVMRSILELLTTLFESLVQAERTPAFWISKIAVSLAVDKISDRKLSNLATTMLTSLCVVMKPSVVLSLVIKAVDSVKAPLSHEATLNWTTSILQDFGAATVRDGVKQLVPWVLKECETSNPKVRKAALSTIEELHVQLGPVFKAVLLASCSESLSSSTKSQIESTLESATFDPNASKLERVRRCVIGSEFESPSHSDADNSGSLGLELPRTDLVSKLSEDYLKRMATKEGKASWKIRKQAMDEVSSELTKCTGLLLSDPQSISGLIEMMKGLRARMGDSQSNLKPVAANIIGNVLGLVDTMTQARLAKVVFPAVVGCAINDNKKVVRDASLAALSKGTDRPELEGGGPNQGSLEVLMGCLTVSMKESDYKAVGLSSVLDLLTSKSEHLPKVESLSAAKAVTAEVRFSSQVVACLTSSKSENRHAASQLLKKCVSCGTLSAQSMEKGVKELLPAQQRSVNSLIAQLQLTPTSEKENSMSSSQPQKTSKARKTKTQPGTPAQTPKRRRPSLPKTKSNELEVTSPLTSDEHKDESKTRGSSVGSNSCHPLKSLRKGSGTTSKVDRMSASLRKREGWPEYPEEPTGLVFFKKLQKLWSPLLPASSASMLFPGKGIAKQDDAIDGAKLISQAVSIAEEQGGDLEIVEQLDLICKWYAVCLCSRENTSGLQKLLASIENVFSYLRVRGYEMSDVEASILLPHLLEKGSLAKGRFRVTYGDIVKGIVSPESGGQLYAPQKYGPLVCVAVVERSVHGKTRVLAMNECRKCIVVAGLNGIGKRGILSFCRAVSEESLSENRSAALDVVELIVEKMHGDIQRLFAFCGTNLSDKGKALIQERWQKHHPMPKEVPMPSLGPTKTEKSRQSLTSRSTKKKTPSGRLSTPSRLNQNSKQNSLTGSGRKSLFASNASSTNLEEDEMPKLKLHLDEPAARSHATSSRGKAPDESEVSNSDGPFTFRYATGLASEKRSEQSSIRHLHSAQSPDVIRVQATDQNQAMRNPVLFSPDKSAASPYCTGKPTSGAAASLRARLNQMREKNGLDVAQAAPSSPGKVSSVTSAASTDTPYKNACNVAERILSLRVPINDSDAAECVEAIRLMHSSVSSTKTHARNFEMREEITVNLPTCVLLLTRVLSFSLRCGLPSDNAGMNVDLLRATAELLTDMFRVKQLAARATSQNLICTIREASLGLLDPRLAPGPVEGSNFLDHSTSTILVKALNKLAIQAAIGSSRETAFEALTVLQLKYCLPTTSDMVRDSSATNERMCKIITKLFARVIKSEEASRQPFHATNIQSVLNSVEQMLHSFSESRSAESESVDFALDSSPCHELAQLLLSAMKKAANDNTSESARMKKALDDIQRTEGVLGCMLSNDGRRLENDFPNPKTGHHRDAVSDLLFTRRHTDVYDSTRQQPNNGTLPNSERIRFLRSKLHATEAALQSTVEGAASRMPSQEHTTDESSNNVSVHNSYKPGHGNSRLSALKERLAASQETTAASNLHSGVATCDVERLHQNTTAAAVDMSEPSNFATLAKVSSCSSSSKQSSPKPSDKILSLRERLATAQEGRAAAEGPLDGNPSVSSHAAKLRARLEAMKERAG